MCYKCFVDHSNARWEASGCKAEDVCRDPAIGRDCDIWPKPEVAPSPAAAKAAAAAAANDVEWCERPGTPPITNGI